MSDAGSRDRVARAIVVLLGLLLGAWCAARFYPGTYLHTDGVPYATINRAIVDGFTLEVGRYHPRSWYDGRARGFPSMDHGTSWLARGRDGRLWPKHPFLLPIASTPLYLLLGLPGLLVFNLLATLAALALCHRFATRFAGAWPAALATLACALALGTLEQVYGYSNDIFCTLLVVGALVLLAERRPLAAGLVAGLALWAKVTLVLVLAPMSIALLVSTGATRREWLRFGAALALPCALHAAANAYLFGAPWLTSYGRVLVHEGGVQRIDPIGRHFGRGAREGLVALMGPRSGVLQQLPAALVAPLGLLALLIARRQRVLASAGLVALVGSVALFVPYEWGEARLLLPLLPIVTLGLAALLAFVLDRPPPERAPEALPPRRGEGPLLRAAGVILAALALPSLGAIALHRPPERLSGRVEAAVAEHDGEPCDFFDPQLGRLGCARVRFDRAHPAGAPPEGACLQGERVGPLIWLAPERAGAEVRLRWRGLPPMDRVELLLAADRPSPGAEPTLVELRLDGQHARTLQLPASATLRRVTLTHPALARGPASLELVRTGHGRGAACVDLRWTGR